MNNNSIFSNKRKYNSLYKNDDFYYDDKFGAKNFNEFTSIRIEERKTHLRQLKEKEDDINYGFDFRGQLFFRSLSSMIYQNMKYANIFLYMDRWISFLIDYVKMIKKFRNYHFDKDYRKFN